MAASSTHIALLRGINVGGKNKLPMAELREMLTELGCEDTRTYIQSGNVVFRGSAAFAKALPARASEAVAQRFGLQVPFIIRSGRAWAKIAKAHPLARAKDEARLLCVLFLPSKPNASARARLEERPPGEDDFVLEGLDLYIRYAKGAGSTKLTNAWFDRRLGMQGTARNWRSVQKLRELSA